MSASQVTHQDAMIQGERLTASLDGDFVVFLIGMRINQPLKLHRHLA